MSAENRGGIEVIISQNERDHFGTGREGGLKSEEKEGGLLHFKSHLAGGRKK